MHIHIHIYLHIHKYIIIFKFGVKYFRVEVVNLYRPRLSTNPWSHIKKM